MATIESKNLLVWVKAMSRGKNLPLDASEVYDSLAAAETYAGSSAIAYPGQTIKALHEDGTYHSYVLQPSESGYTLSEVGALKASDLTQYVQVVDELPTTGYEEGIIYLVNKYPITDDPSAEPGVVGVNVAYVGWVRIDNEWVKVFDHDDYAEDISLINDHLNNIQNVDLPSKAPIYNPVFTGTVKVGTEEVAVKSYVDGLISNLESRTPVVLTNSIYLDKVEYKAGESYRVAEAGTYFGHKCEVGDLVLILVDSNDSTGMYDKVMVIQANIDGAVTSTADTSTVGEIVVFDAVTGKVIKGSGVQIASLNDAIAKAHEHSNKAKLDTYDKTQAELLAAAKAEAQGLVDAHDEAVTEALDGKADKATTLAGYSIADAYNKTEIDNQLKTITDNLNTKISTTDTETKIANAKEEALEEAATAASEALEARVGNIPTDTTIQSYIDTAVGSGGTASAQAIATAKQEAITESKSYTDTQIASAMAVVNF